MQYISGIYVVHVGWEFGRCTRLLFRTSAPKSMVDPAKKERRGKHGENAWDGSNVEQNEQSDPNNSQRTSTRYLSESQNKTENRHRGLGLSGRSSISTRNLNASSANHNWIWVRN